MSDVSPQPQLSDIASTYVRQLIMSGELLPGASVRPELIGESLGISTTPAREALQALRVEGFLQLVPRRGFQVAPLTGKDIRDLFAVQALISGELATRAAKKATNSDIDELEALHLELIAAAKRNDLEELEAKNHQFHRHINRLADSRKLLWALGMMTRYVPRRFYADIPGWPQSTVDDHSKILEAIRSRDPVKIGGAVQAHLEHAGELLASHFDARLQGLASVEMGHQPAPVVPQPTA
jgi:DNA-binding GntR family transcriptional regulator